MKHKSRYFIGCSFLLMMGCSVDDEAESGQISRGYAESAALTGGDIDATPNKNLSYATNPGAITSIKYGNHVLTTGGGYNAVLSCDGPDHQATNGESRSGRGIFLTTSGVMPACGRIPYKMTFAGTNSIDSKIEIGPFASPTAIVSLALDLNKSHTTDFEFLGSNESGWKEGCGYPQEGSWRSVSGQSRGRFADLKSPCFIDGEHPVAVAKRVVSPGLVMRARGLQGDITRTIKSIKIRDAAGHVVSGSREQIEIQAAFYSHPGTNSLAIEILPTRSAGRIPKGYSLEIEETIVVTEPSIAPGDLFTCGELRSGQSLSRGQFIDSCDGKTRLWHQTEGNVVLYSLPELKARWQSNTSNFATSKLLIQSDGNLVLLNGREDKVLFHTGTYNNYGSKLLIRNNGDIVINSADDQTVWRSSCGQLLPDQWLARGQYLDSCDRGTRLWHQSDGNLVLYRMPNMTAVWQSGTANSSTSKLIMQSDGNLVLLNSQENRAVFHTATYGKAGAYLFVRNQGDLVVNSSENIPLYRVGR
jgi:hypothetical protein